MFLEMRDVSKIYRDRYVLKDINLAVEKGEILAIAGPPGAGKTTLLKIVAGLIAPTKGRVYLSNTDITDLPPHKRNFSMIFEVPPIYPDRTGYENIAFPLRLKKLPEDEIRRRVYEVAELLNIKHILDRKPSTYSGGEYQRAALARALVTNPIVLLLDEPLRSLDAKIREQMVVWLKQLQSNLKITMIYSTHDPLEALTIGSKVALLLNGVVKQWGEPLEVLRNPIDLEVDEYITIPALNILRGKARVSEGRLIIEFDRISVVKNVDKFIELGGEEVIVAIRPSDIEISKDSKCCAIRGKIDLIQHLGNNILVTLRVDDLQLRAIAPRTMQINEGSEIYISLDPVKVRIYDAKTLRKIC